MTTLANNKKMAEIAMRENIDMCRNCEEISANLWPFLLRCSLLKLRHSYIIYACICVCMAYTRVTHTPRTTQCRNVFICLELNTIRFISVTVSFYRWNLLFSVHSHLFLSLLFLLFLFFCFSLFPSLRQMRLRLFCAIHFPFPLHFARLLYIHIYNGTSSDPHVYGKCLQMRYICGYNFTNVKTYRQPLGCSPFLAGTFDVIDKTFDFTDSQSPIKMKVKRKCAFTTAYSVQHSWAQTDRWLGG